MAIPFPLSFNYQPGQGVWEPVTATINWCEEDYYATIYSAEIINSLTNLIFVYLALVGISNCVKNGHDTVFLIGFLSYLVIGVGSFCFHSTLRYGMQLLDELSMIYTTCVMFYAIFSRRQKPVYHISNVCLILFVTSIAAFITLYYHYLKDPVFHQNAFALLTAVVFFRSLYLMEMTLRPSKRIVGGVGAKRQFEYWGDDNDRARRDRRDEAILSFMWSKMIPFGLTLIALGFLIWNLDNIYCSNLRRWRRQIGLPWGILLEGHGWWHIFTGSAQYFNLTWSIWLRYCFDGKQDDVELIWPSVFNSVPRVVKRQNQHSSKSKLNLESSQLNDKISEERKQQ